MPCALLHDGSSIVRVTPRVHLQTAISNMGGNFTASESSVSVKDDPNACQSHFGHWCIDGAHISRGGIIAVIVCVGFFVLLCIVLIPVCAVMALRRRRQVPK